MGLDNSKFKPRNSAAESVFIRMNQELVTSRVNEIAASRSLLHAIPSAENLLPSQEQVMAAVQQFRAPDASPTTAAAVIAVAHTERADFEASSRSAVESIHAAPADPNQTPETPLASVIPLNPVNTGPEVDAARQAVADIDIEAA